MKEPVSGIDRACLCRCRQCTGKAGHPHATGHVMSNAHTAFFPGLCARRHDVRCRPASERTDDCTQPPSSFAGCRPAGQHLRGAARHGAIVPPLHRPAFRPENQHLVAVMPSARAPCPALLAASTKLEQFAVQAVFRYPGFAHQLAYLLQQSARPQKWMLGADAPLSWTNRVKRLRNPASPGPVAISTSSTPRRAARPCRSSTSGSSRPGV